VFSSNRYIDCAPKSNRRGAVGLSFLKILVNVPSYRANLRL